MGHGKLSEVRIGAALRTTKERALPIASHTADLEPNPAPPRDSCCECYGAINAHFQRLIGWSPNGEAEAQRTAD